MKSVPVLYPKLSCPIDAIIPFIQLLLPTRESNAATVWGSLSAFLWKLKLSYVSLLGSLLDFLKDGEGRALKLPNLVDMAAQVGVGSCSGCGRLGTGTRGAAE